MKRLIYFGLGSILFSNILYAQSEVDVLRYSQTTIGGTARSMAMGGAMGAVGADFSTLSSNPAGMGLYKHTEISFSPTFFGQNSSTSFLGNPSTNDKYNFSFNGAGAVYSYDTGNENGWNNFNFGFGYNRQQDFNVRNNYSSATNYNSSIIDAFKDDANKYGYGNSKFFSDLASNAGILFGKNPYYSDLDSARIKHPGNIGVVQGRTMASSGGMGEVNFAFGANYNNKLYLGASINIITLNYNESVTYTESDKNGNIPNFQSLQFNQQLSTSGTGSNLKFGAIYRVADWVRVGAYYHTPSVLNLTDDYTSDLTANYKNKISLGTDSSQSFSSQSPSGNFSYQITTPARQGANVAFIIGKKAIISADIEHINYASARITSDSDPFNDANQRIQNEYRSAYNFKFGGEYRIDNVFSLRAGYNYYQSPFKTSVINAIEADKSTSVINTTNTASYTGGLGIRGEGYFIDFAYVYTQQGQYLFPYALSPNSPLTVNPASIKNTAQSFVATIGFKF